MTPLNFVGVISFILLSYSNLLRTVFQNPSQWGQVQNYVFIERYRSILKLRG